jgi:hypothetical protein
MSVFTQMAAGTFFGAIDFQQEDRERKGITK